MRKGSNLKKPFWCRRSAWDGTYAVPQAVVQQIFGFLSRLIAASPSSPKKDFSNHTITVRPTQAILLPGSQGRFHSPFISAYRIHIGLDLQNHYGVTLATGLPPLETKPGCAAKFHCY